jgi:hypothetical protein
MKLVAAIVAAGLLALTAVGLEVLGLWGDDPFDRLIEAPSVQLSVLGIATDDPIGELEESGNACQRLAGLSAALGHREQNPRGFLRALGREAAGIRPPSRALADLARGGRDLIPGRGFRATYADGTDGQARHFAGLAVATTYGGTTATRLASVFLRRDPVDSPDGRLGERAFDFASLVSSGELPLAETGAWILANLCRPAGIVPR